ncbi:unnamed protein product [Caenorhabditis nigoni]
MKIFLILLISLLIFTRISDQKPIGKQLDKKDIGVPKKQGENCTSLPSDWINDCEDSVDLPADLNPEGRKIKKMKKKNPLFYTVLI